MAALPLIYNPRSAGGAGGKRMAAARALLAARGIEVAPEATAGPGGAKPLAARLAAHGHERILVVGGDGTLSEAADGALSAERPPTLGFLPGGTGNSFLLDFGLVSLEAAADRIASGASRAIDVGLVRWSGGERHFIDCFGVGFMANVASLANRRLKWMGATAYTVAVLPEVARLRAPMTRLTLDGELHEEMFALVAVNNTIHTGGAMKIAPMARPDDGMLDVIALRDVGRLGLLRLFPKIFDGSHIGHKGVFVGKAREITIEPSKPSPLLHDGEIYGSTPVTITTKPGALRVLV